MDSLNGDMLSMILRMLGVRNVRAYSDTPGAKISIQFERYGQIGSVEYTIGELIQAIEGPQTPASQGAPEGYTDIATLPDPSSGILS